MSHGNALLAQQGRLKIARLVVEDGWQVRRLAERLPCSPPTAAKWAGRHRQGHGLTNRSLRLHPSPGRIPDRVKWRIIGLRANHRWVRIALLTIRAFPVPRSGVCLAVTDDPGWIALTG